MLEVLGVLIAFVALMLLLSVFVTIGAHFMQSVLRLRGRSLERGIAELLPALTSLDRKDAERVARRICEAPNVDPTRDVVLARSGGPRDELLNRLVSWVKGTARSSMTTEELTEAVSAVATAYPRGPTRVLVPVDRPLVPEQSGQDLTAHAARLKESVRELHPRVVRVSKQRFAFRMRVVSVLCAAVIAVGYQMSTPELLRRLSANEVLARFDITPWPYGASYYVKDGSVEWRVLIGVLMTTILLTLGAPFWYQQLKGFSGLRDALAPRSEGLAAASKDGSPPS